MNKNQESNIKQKRKILYSFFCGDLWRIEFSFHKKRSEKLKLCHNFERDSDWLIYLSPCKEYCELDFGFGNNMAVSCADRPLEALHPSRSLVKSVIEFTKQRLLSAWFVLHQLLSLFSPPLASFDLVYRDCVRVAIISTPEYNYLGYWNNSMPHDAIRMHYVQSFARFRQNGRVVRVIRVDF